MTTVMPTPCWEYVTQPTGDHFLQTLQWLRQEADGFWCNWHVVARAFGDHRAASRVLTDAGDCAVAFVLLTGEHDSAV